MRRRRLLATTLAATTLAMTACSPAEFAREQQPADRPKSVVDGAADQIDVTTLRHVGKADEYDIYLARGSEDHETLCLSLVVDDLWRATDCEWDYVSVPISDSANVAASIDYRGGEDREMISDNVWITRK